MEATFKQLAVYVDLHNKLQLAQIADQFVGRFAESAPFADRVADRFAEQVVMHIKFYF